MIDESVFSAGDLLEDRYRIIRLLGKGGAGEVYEIQDLRRDRRGALKTVVRDQVDNAKAPGRFRREMECSQRISHPNVLQIFDLFQASVAVSDPLPASSRGHGAAPRPPGTRTVEIPCMTMEFLDGETLADRLEREEVLSTDEARPIVCQMAAALASAHGKGIVHRDLKPDNVFLVPGEDGPRVVLTDFGVARRMVATDPDDTNTASNVILGTPGYMAPEQLELEKAMPASDVYAMGLVMFEMLTGHQPFEAESAIKMVFKRVQEDPPSPREYLPDLDRRWEAAILRCLARDPDARFDDPLDIIRTLDGEDSDWLKDERAGQRRRFLLMVAAWLAGLAVIAAALLTVL